MKDTTVIIKMTLPIIPVEIINADQFGLLTIDGIRPSIYISRLVSKLEKTTGTTIVSAELEYAEDSVAWVTFSDDFKIVFNVDIKSRLLELLSDKEYNWVTAIDEIKSSFTKGD